jgi:membrane-bound lytic murein transglycosylase D
MRSAKLYLRTIAFSCLTLVVCACQSAQKPVSLLPPGSAPSLRAPTPATPTTPAAQAPTQASTVVQAEQTPAPAATPQETTPPEPAAVDAIADLIASVEKEYQAGLANYQAGKTEEAKQNFDNAFNALLGSNLDVRSDKRLEDEFDHMVEGVNRLDLGGLSPDTEAQQKSEPAPIDETNEIAPSADASVKAKAQAEIKSTRSDLPLMMTDQVAGYISYFSNRGRGTFERAFARSGRYHDMIVSTFKEEGVPQDLIYLAQAESGFHPLAVSRAGARGIWQFMASRGRGYGLSHSMWVDDRQDPEKSTRAAARHLKDLYKQFGDWYLAMAAYNSGPGTVQAAVKRTGYADFWELYRRNVLPKETRNYVPIILAVTIMAKNPSQYGLNDVAMGHPAAYDAVTINYPVDLRLVAECIDSTPDTLQDLNPSLLRLTTPRDGKFELHLPGGTKDQYEAAITSIPPDMRLWWRYHTVHSGDTLASLAHTYHTTPKLIVETNHLEASALEADAKLIIPVAPGKHPVSDTATYARRITRYKVHKGDSVESVAENFGISAQMLRRWNGLHGDSLRGRKVLALHLPISPSARDAEVATAHSKSKHSSKTTQTAVVKPPATKSAQIEREEEAESTPPAVVHHKVRTGETLYSIATYYKTTVAALKHDNRNIAVLRPGMILIIPVAR